MPFIPHTDADTQTMLDKLELDSIIKLYDEIPSDIPQAKLDNIELGASELEITQLMQQREPNNKTTLCFIGAGAYEHHIPAAVWDIVGRGEFYTAYTPYQAEASQGSLQVIYEYQSMMTSLLSMEVSNASMYDGASALAEAALMSIRLQRGKRRKILAPTGLHPAYRRVLLSILEQQDIEIDFVALTSSGEINKEEYQQQLDQYAAVILSQPNFLGVLEDIDTLTELAHQHSTLVIAHVNPLSCALLKPPGEWGDTGADIACGEGQPLGVPLNSGGPYFGFMCTRKKFIRQLPGRIVAKTNDANGNTGYTLTLQAREQHIRRSKATSNICTNQGLLMVAATIHMRLLGGKGLQDTAAICHKQTQKLADGLASLKHIDIPFQTPYFNELVIQLTSHSAKDVLSQLRGHNIQGGYDLTVDYPELGECILICATETKTDKDIEHYIQSLSNILGE